MDAEEPYPSEVPQRPFRTSEPADPRSAVKQDDGWNLVGLAVVGGVAFGLWWLISRGIDRWLGGRFPTSIQWWVAAGGVICVLLMAMSVRYKRFETPAGTAVLLTTIGAVAGLIVGGVAGANAPMPWVASEAASKVCDEISESHGGDRPTFNAFFDARNGFFDRWAKSRVVDTAGWSADFDAAYAASCPHLVPAPEALPDGTMLTLEHLDDPATSSDNGPSVADVIQQYGGVVCDRLSKGWSYADIVDGLMATGDANAEEARLIAEAAIAEHCPGYGP
ncbi:DUF732 domain-containing protein [Cellulosimicrobium sp. 22601]|uniref:DUF732 domain-containing protein n=1 Tax=unclassified Cellulosimicrobium TaxID=2624466 RepID=UPI003F84E432